MVINKIKGHILTYENLSQRVYLVNEEMDASAGEYHMRLNTVVAEINNVNSRLERLYDALEHPANFCQKLGLFGDDDNYNWCHLAK